MFGILDLIFLGANLINSITLTTTADYLVIPTSRESVVSLSTKREWWRDDGKGKCTFEGVMVPFVQDWDEVVVEGDLERTIKANPDRTVAQAILLNRKLCKGKEPEAIMRGAVIHSTKGYLFSATPIYAGDLLESRPGEVPKWFQQVVARIERVSETDAEAKSFLNDSQPELIKVAAIGDPFGNTLLKTHTVSSVPSDERSVLVSDVR